jgi:hypothetical protein
MGKIITRKDGHKFHVGGRLIPKTPHKLMLHKYGLNLSKWPATPPSTSYGNKPAVQDVMTDILGNDTLGDCTEADQYHRQALRQGASGVAVFHPTLTQVIATYGRDGGYAPDQPDTDQGCDETVVLQNASTYGITNGSDLYKTAGFVGVDGSNWELVRAAVSLFVGASICVSLPDEWIQSFSAGCTWDAPKGGVFDPANGHCFTGADQTADKLGIWTWAEPAFLTPAALAAACANSGAIYFELDTDILAAVSSAAPDGADWAAISAAFVDAGGTPPDSAPYTIPPSVGP